MKFKKYLKNNLLVLVLLLTVLAKSLEWLGQYTISNSILINNPSHTLLQIGFILTVSIILFVGFNYIKFKKKDYLLIPVLAYFIKEVFNFLFIYGRVINQVTIIALVIEPILLYFIIQTINKYWLKLK